MKALVGAFNQEKALVGAFSVIVKTGCGTDGAFYSTILEHEAGALLPAEAGRPPPAGRAAYPAEHGLGAGTAARGAAAARTRPRPGLGGDVVHLAAGHLLPVDEEGEAGVLHDLLAEDEDEVVPLPLLHDVGEPDPGPPVPAPLGLPVAVLLRHLDMKIAVTLSVSASTLHILRIYTCAHLGVLAADDDRLVPGGDGDGEADRARVRGGAARPRQGQQPHRVRVMPGVAVIIFKM